MHKKIMICLVTALIQITLFTIPVLAQSQNENRVKLFNEFIREIIVLHQISEQSTIDLREARNTTEQYTAVISSGERYNENFNFAKEYLIKWNYSKAVVMMDFAGISERLLAPPPNYNPADDTILAPKLTARSQQLDKDFMQISTAMLLMLVDEKPDTSGKMSNLIITKSQKDKIIADINLYFQKYENIKNNNYFIESGLLVKDVFEKKGYNFAK
jgi:hypothetical protein